MRIYRLAILIVLTSLAVPKEVRPETALPRPTGWVVDEASVIDPATEQKLSALLTQLERQTGIEIAVVTIPSLEGSDIETYAVNLYQTWGIGKKGKDNGLLLLAAIEDRQARIEVGYGLEGGIPDAYAGRVLREVIFPSFKEGNYGEGIVRGTVVLIGRLQEVYQFELEGAPARIRQGGSDGGPSLFSFLPWYIAWPLKILIGIGLIILFIRHPFLFFMLLGMRGGGGFRSGGFGGGFGGFGGGLSGGGGASGRW